MSGNGAVGHILALVENGNKTNNAEIKLDMTRSVITEPLLSKVMRASDPGQRFDVIISLNELFKGGVDGAMRFVVQRAREWGVADWYELAPYIFVCLSAEQLLNLAQEARELTDKHGKAGSLVYRIWEDQEVNTTITQSVSTVKVDAAQRAFRAFGKGIVWAVLDSGIQGDHPHFAGKQTHFQDGSSVLPVVQRDFTPDGRAVRAWMPAPPPDLGDVPDFTALLDRFGHGSHVAGIIAGWWESPDPRGETVIGTEMRDERTDKPIPQRTERLTKICGMAPDAKLISLKVIADVTSGGDVQQTAGQGRVSWILMAIDQIQKWNQNGKRLVIHGANLSLGYPFNPRWFACGQSPLCVEVNRLVKSGVAVVVSAGNDGYVKFMTESGQSDARYNGLSITDPGNADLAVTVGSTHREKPHLYGVSYFSSRGPTGDGRMKPDLLAPGERIISCAAGQEAAKYRIAGQPDVLYCEQTGTSMAAPHVSGAIAAFLSVRSEYIGEPEQVKELFMANTIDLRRERCFQGAGLMDLMKVLQAC